MSIEVNRAMISTSNMFNGMIIPRPTAKFSVDLTGAKLFIQDTAAHVELVQVVGRFSKDKLVPFGPDHSILLTACIRLMLRALTSMFATWSSEKIFGPEDVEIYRKHIN